MQKNQYKHKGYAQNHYLKAVLITEVLEGYARALSFMPKNFFKHLHSIIQELSMDFGHNNVFRII